MITPILKQVIPLLLTIVIGLNTNLKNLSLPSLESLTATITTYIDDRYSAVAESKVLTRPLSEETVKRMGGIITRLDLPPLELLNRSLTTYTELERDAKLKALETKSSSNWHDLLPSLGVAYTPTGDPRPSANWSPLQILDRKDRKKQNKQAKESIILSYELLLTDRIYKLQQLYHDYMIDLRSLEAQKEAIEIDEKLFEITQAKYDQNLIKPSEYLTAKKAVLEVRSDYQILEQELLKKRKAILYEAKYN